jgi:hypothetical protein
MTQQLDTRLTQLQSAAELQSQSHAASRQQLYENFVDAYLWWREADVQKDYLKAAFKTAAIVTRKRKGNAPNFYAIIRLIWDIDTSTRAGAVSNWARSMEGLHTEYVENTKLYEHNARAELLNFIHDSNGLGKLRGDTELTEGELEGEEVTGINNSIGRPKAVAPNAKNVYEQKKQNAKTVSALASVPTFHTAVTNNDGLLVMVGRRNSAGDIEIVGSDYSDDAISNALRVCTSIDRAAVTHSLRLIAEALEPHALPAKLEKRRKKYFEKSGQKRKGKDGKSSDVKRNTTLRIRPQHNDILIAKSPADVGIVSYVQPKHALSTTAEVTLNGRDRQWIEKELLGLEKLVLYTAESEHTLDVDTSARKADYLLRLTDAEKAHVRNIYFYDVTKLKTPNANVQPTIKNATKLTFDWEIEVTPQWLAELDATCMTAWINSIGGQFDKAENACIGFDVHKDKLELRAWWDEKDTKFQQSYNIPFSKSAKVKQASKLKTFTCSPKDAAPFFATLPTLPVTSANVTIRANQHVMEISYATELANYLHYIPATNTKGEYDRTLFEAYGGTLEDEEDQA